MTARVLMKNAALTTMSIDKKDSSVIAYWRLFLCDSEASFYRTAHKFVQIEHAYCE